MLVKPCAAGRSIQVRLYAEDPGEAFPAQRRPAHRGGFPRNARVETWVERGTEVTPYYDPHAGEDYRARRDAPEAIGKLRDRARRDRVAGIETNLEYLRQYRR